MDTAARDRKARAAPVPARVSADANVPSAERDAHQVGKQIVSRPLRLPRRQKSETLAGLAYDRRVALESVGENL